MPTALSSLQFVIRVDASYQIGSGHVMRCLTLAEGIRAKGGAVQFICRDHPGHLIEMIRTQGFSVSVLPPPQSSAVSDGYDDWLGATWQQDLAQTAACVTRDDATRWDWVIIDHYAIDENWEAGARKFARKVMIIDDLANRNHACDLLVDQNLNRSALQYQSIVPANCVLLTGTDYAMLRPEFYEARCRMAKSDANPASGLRILVALGGADPENITLKILTSMARYETGQHWRIDVILGAQNLHRTSIKAFASHMKSEVSVAQGVNNMAERYAEADVAIGAPGTSSWERCVLGLPVLLVVLADNQRENASALAREGVGVVIAEQAEAVGSEAFDRSLIHYLTQREWMTNAAGRALTLCDGQGVDRVLARLMLEHN